MSKDVRVNTALRGDRESLLYTNIYRKSLASPPAILLQLDKIPPSATASNAAAGTRLTEQISFLPAHTKTLHYNPGVSLPCTAHRPIIIVEGLWDFRVFEGLSSRLIQWLQLARRNKCPMFGFGFAHLAMNVAFGGNNHSQQYPGLKTAHKNVLSMDIVTAVLTDHFAGWSVCSKNACRLPFSTEVLASTQRNEPMLVRYDGRTYSTPLSLSLNWSGIIGWLRHHPEQLTGNESVFEYKVDSSAGKSMLRQFIAVWGPQHMQ